MRFFEAALREIGVDTVSVEDGASARGAISNGTFDVLLIDRHLPDMSGEALLQAVRDAGCVTPAIATSAEIDADVRARMLDAAFDDVIAKPVSVEHLRRVVGRFVDLAAPPLLSDDQALRSIGGNRESLTALRRLLAAELDELRATHATPADRPTLVARLHRLRASCGFCGATALGDAAAVAQTALNDGDAVDWPAFLSLCAATATALREPPSR